MNKTSLLHGCGVNCVIAAMFFVSYAIFRAFWPETQIKAEEEFIPVVNSFGAMIVFGLFGLLFFTWNMSRRMENFLKAVLMVEKEKGE